jgi:hypothetical protein
MASAKIQGSIPARVVLLSTVPSTSVQGERQAAPAGRGSPLSRNAVSNASVKPPPAESPATTICSGRVPYLLVVQVRVRGVRFSASINRHEYSHILIPVLRILPVQWMLSRMMYKYSAHHTHDYKRHLSFVQLIIIISVCHSARLKGLLCSSVAYSTTKVPLPTGYDLFLLSPFQKCIPGGVDLF